jgi:hypothetical protein
VKPALVLGLAGAMALGSITASDARGRGWVAGAAGFAVAAAIGAAAATANNYYYAPGYGAYAYAPGYAYNPGYAYTGDPAYSYGYAPGVADYNYGYQPYGGGAYDSNYIGPARARQLEGRDY